MANQEHTKWGNEFRDQVKTVLDAELGTELQKEFRTKPRGHRFDLGSRERGILVECKKHKWTEGNNVPEAKLNDWVVTILRLARAPEDYTIRILAVMRHERRTTGETLGAYFLRTARGRDIPSDVEVREFDF